MVRSISAKLLLISLTLLLMAGCGKQIDWKGDWIGDRGVKARMGEDPSIVGTMSRVKVTIHEDGSFVIEDGGVPIEGPSSADGNDLHLKPEKVMGGPAKQAGPPLTSPLLMQMQKDGSAIYSREGSPERIKMTRASSVPLATQSSPQP